MNDREFLYCLLGEFEYDLDDIQIIDLRLLIKRIRAQLIESKVRTREEKERRAPNLTKTSSFSKSVSCTMCEAGFPDGCPCKKKD